MRTETIAIMLIALAAAFFSYYANKKFGKREKVKELQKKVNDYQKELKKAYDEKNEARIKELKEREPEMLKAMQEMMLLPFRSMIIIAPLYLILLAIVLPALFPKYVVTLPFSLPSWYTIWEASSWRNWFGARGFFIWSAIFFGIIMIELFWTRVEKRLLNFLKPRQESKQESKQETK